MTKHLPRFQQYQLAFTARLRDPLGQPLLEGVDAERMAVYEEIVFNNIHASISACFPVARTVLGEQAWQVLTRAFMREYSAHDPLFRRIPQQFVAFLTNAGPELQQSMPPYLTDLCHYEWIELFVSTMPSAMPDSANVMPASNLLEHRPAFTPTMQLLDYAYAVHKISLDYIPEHTESKQLLVYRNADNDVKFIALNAVTFRLLTLLQQEKIKSKQALILLAEELKHPQPEAVIQFGLEILEDLRTQGAIIGVYDSQHDTS